jgi:hypothetical protein
MILPQEILIRFHPIDDGSIANITIKPKYKCDKLTLLEYMMWATQELEDALDADT